MRGLFEIAHENIPQIWTFVNSKLKSRWASALGGNSVSDDRAPPRKTSMRRRHLGTRQSVGPGGLRVERPNCPDGLWLLFIAGRALHLCDLNRVVHDVSDADLDSEFHDRF